MAKYIRDSEFRKLVRICLDENMSSAALSALGDIDTLKLDEIIDSKVEDAALQVVMAAPISKLGDLSESLNETPSIAESKPYIGVMTLPINFARLLRFKMRGWRHAVFESLLPASPLYEEANNGYNTFGTKDRPAVFIVPSTTNGKDLQLEFFCASSTDDVPDGCLYVARPKIEAIASDSSDSGSSGSNGSSGSGTGDSGSGSGGSGGSGNSDDNGGGGNDTTVSVTGITLNKSTLALVEGEEEALTAEVTPSNATNKAVTWSSDDEAVATVEGGTVTGNGEGTCTVTCTAADGSEVSDECEVTVSAPSLEGHEYVDLDLPSKTLWATCNVGASSPEGYGDYFAWGETEQKEIEEGEEAPEYNWNTYQHCNGSNKKLTKYCTQSSYGNNGFTDGLTSLLPGDDAARVKWGGVWQMPSNSQIEELLDESNTSVVWSTLNNVNGLLITSKHNGKSIFLPAAGHRNWSNLISAGSNGSYWTQSLSDESDPSSAAALFFRNSNVAYYLAHLDKDARSDGFSVRPVCVLPTLNGRKKVRINNVQSVSDTGSNASWQILLGERLLRPTIYYAAHLTALAVKDGDAAAALLNTAKELLEN